MAKKHTYADAMAEQAQTLARALLMAYGLDPDKDIVSREHASAAYAAALKGATCHRLEAKLTKKDLKLIAVGDATGDRKPLVERFGNLYLQRYDALEADLAAYIEKKAQEIGGRHTVSDRWLKGCDASQMDAVRLAGTTSLMILTGGPGTGKTTTATRILASALVDGGIEIDRVRLCAPTGRAASRLRESIVNSQILQGAGLDIDRLQPAQTMHKLLHDKEQMAVTKLFLVDECSMIDLHIFAQFIQHAPEGSKVILLGDPRQLPSVETGSVFGDLCETKRLSQIRANLTHNHRLPPAVHAAALNVMNQKEGKPLESIEPNKDAVVEACASDYAKLVKAAEASDFIKVDALINSVRVLCSHHGGQTGVTALNIAIQEKLGLRSASQPGQVIMVTQNDSHVTGLMNGDVGVVVPGKRAKFFGRPTTFALSDLRGTVSAFATTIHKSQGSEYEKVLLVLSDSEQEGFLCRELLFTGVTRAKAQLGPLGVDKAAIFASKKSLEAMLAAGAKRASGLKERLDGLG
jgi:exodeoxyribonuclease V alpha subunit